MPVPARVAQRITSELRRYQKILAAAKQRDVSESDTALIVGDILTDVLGYTKYEHVTTEYAIRGTYSDLAVVCDGEVRFLVEVKAIGLDLKDTHIRQVVNYGANKGVEWVILSSGSQWRVYKIHFGQPIDRILVFESDLLTASPRDESLIECLGTLSREGFSRTSMADFLQKRQITSKYSIASVLLTDPILLSVRRELRRLSPGLRIDIEGLRESLTSEVLKRELVEGDEAKAAAQIIRRLQRNALRERRREAESARTVEEIPVPSSEPSA